jgi:2-aminoadipate transaminase
MGSFSKVLAPGLRIGFIVAPKSVYGKLTQAKQAADLHTPSFNQRVVAEVIKDGFLDRHVPTIRAMYKVQRDVMLMALEREMAGLDVQWTRPVGGMFLWVKLPAAWTPRPCWPRPWSAIWLLCPARPSTPAMHRTTRCACRM